MLLQYAFEASRSGLDNLLLAIPVYNLLNAAVVALIVDAFIRRGAYQIKWNLLLLLPILVLVDAILSTAVPALDALCDAGMFEADALEAMRSFPEQLSESLAPSGFLNRVRSLLLRYGLTLPVALALYHLIPAKLRKSINGSRWMQATLPPKLLAQVGRTKSRHSLKTRITVLVVIAIVLSAGIITLINASNTAMVSAYDQATKLINAGAFTGSVITPERVKEYLEKGAEAPGYEETAALLQSYVESTADLSRLYVLRIAEEGATVIFDATDDGQTPQGIKEYPFLSVAAHYHHERYDGRGYPEGLKGEAIPEIGRIIAVADAYDAMASNRSYRSAIPQHIVREELVKDSGGQFDPEFARIMIQMIDHDTAYRMQETKPGESTAPITSLRCDSIYHDCTEGHLVTVSNRSHPPQGSRACADHGRGAGPGGHTGAAGQYAVHVPGCHGRALRNLQPARADRRSGLRRGHPAHRRGDQLHQRLPRGRRAQY